MDLCIDTQILVFASSGDEECAYYQFLSEFMNCHKLLVAIDPYIQQEYNDKMRPDRFGQYWLTAMAKHGRVVSRDRIDIKRAVKRELLDDLHFDSGDIKFVRLALVTEAKRIVAEDDDYSEAVRKLLKKGLGLVVESCALSRSFIRANLDDQPPSSSP
jgi:hypothetical protein